MTDQCTTYSRGQLAISTGVKGETIRYYEKCGLLDLADAGDKTCEQVRQTTVARFKDVQDKVRGLRKMERTLKGLIGKCEANSSPDCPIIDALFI